MKPRPSPVNGICRKCGANEWQIVEQTQQWHHGRFVPGTGFLFKGNHEWDQVSDEGDPLYLECRACLAQYEVPEYTWR
jgi:hypothetical protein